MPEQAVSAAESEIATLRDWCERLERKTRRQHLLVEVLGKLSLEMKLDVLLGRIISQTTVIVEADRSSLFLYDRQKHELWSKIAQGLDTEEIRFSADQGITGYVVRTGEVVNIRDAYEDPRFNQDIDRETGYRTCSMLAMPMISRRGEVIGAVQVLNKRGGGAFDDEDEEFLGALASNAAVFIENAQLYGQIEELFEAFVDVSITAIDERDPCTSGHSARVTQYTMNLARLVHEDNSPRFKDIRFTRDQFRELRYASLMHDYGKIGVRENVLTKATRLNDDALQVVLERLDRLAVDKRLEVAERKLAGETVDEKALAADLARLLECRELCQRVNGLNFLSDEKKAALDAVFREGLLTPREHENLTVRKGNLTAAERADIESHVSRSFHILRKIPWPDDLKNLPEIAYTHHEKLDGSGYPRGIKDSEIPLGGKMMCVADIYDALTASDRPYKKAVSHERACEILREEEAAQGKMDSALLELFIKGRAWDIGTQRRSHSVLLQSVL